MRVAVLCAVVGICPVAALAQAPLTNGNRLQLGTDSMAIYLERSEGRQRIGTLWDELHQSAIEGRPVLRRVYRTENAVFGPHLDTVVSRLPDLKPVSHWSASRGVSLDVRHRPDSVVGRRWVEGQGAHAVARPTDTTRYDGATFDLVIRGASLREGWTVEVPAFLAAQDSVVTLSARVTGSESLSTDGGVVEAWIIEMDFAGLSSTMWVAKESRALLRQIIRLRQDISVVMEAFGYRGRGVESALQLQGTDGTMKYPSTTHPEPHEYPRRHR